MTRPPSHHLFNHTVPITYPHSWLHDPIRHETCSLQLGSATFPLGQSYLCRGPKKIVLRAVSENCIQLKEHSRYSLENG